MQTTDKRNLPKKNRYYQGMIDLNTIEKGKRRRFFSMQKVISTACF